MKGPPQESSSTTVADARSPSTTLADISPAVAVLVSDDTRQLTGTTLLLDGGGTIIV